MATYLGRILAAHRAAAAADDRSEARLAELARSLPPTRGLVRALTEASGLGVIAEIKRRSPSKGSLVEQLDPAALARSYEAGGACGLSVLTDGEFFGGSSEDLAAARAAVTLPVLRKDFTVSRADVYDARIMGADAVLLIVAALSDEELVDLHLLATGLGLDVLVEAHDEAEVGRALRAGADLVGVNQRDLETFSVDTRRALRVAGSIPPGVLGVAESGIDGPAQAAELAAAGYRGVLVGEYLVRSPDPASAVGELREAGSGSIRGRGETTR